MRSEMTNLLEEIAVVSIYG